MSSNKIFNTEELYKLSQMKALINVAYASNTWYAISSYKDYSIEKE